MTDRNEALRLAEPPNIDNLKKIAASDSTTAIRNALLASIKWIQCLEQSLKFEQAASFRNQVAELSAERDQLRAEVERLKPNADRYEWLRDDLDSDWSICKWGDDPIYGAGYYRPDHLPVVADAMIDHARTTHKDEG